MKQLCVWPGTVLTEDQHDDFREFFKKELGAVVGTIEQVTTLPNKDKEGNDVPDTGGRSDIFFTVVEGTNMGVFALKRLALGVRWWEDVLGNGNGKIYSKDKRNN